jgi:ribonuclease HI
MVFGVIEAKLFSSRNGLQLNGQPGVWTLPVWMGPPHSYSYLMAFPKDRFESAILHARIARTLGIAEGDLLEFQLAGVHEKFYLAVSISETVQFDLAIDGMSAGLLTECEFYADRSVYTLRNGEKIEPADQKLYAGMRVTEQSGTGILYFDGASRNNPNGPAGFGYCLYNEADDVLVKGYGYLGAVSSNGAEYAGLLEGFQWAMKLDFEKICIRGDSELVIKQVQGTYRVKSDNLKPYHGKITEMLNKAREKGIVIELQHVPRQENDESDKLANEAIEKRENATICNWANINQQCECSF